MKDSKFGPKMPKTAGGFGSEHYRNLQEFKRREVPLNKDQPNILIGDESSDTKSENAQFVYQTKTLTGPSF